MENIHIIASSQYDAMVFDLDGVITQTQKTHAKAWQRSFDSFMESYYEGKEFRPFDPNDDYFRFVDGKPRDEGVRSFLASRDITVPEGRQGDDEEALTVLGLCKKKNDIFLKLLHEGFKVYDASIELILKLNNFGFKTAVVSSSKNCRAILHSANLFHLFDAVVDGTDQVALGLRGKPEPDLFLEALKRINVKPERAAMVEDALPGIEAGKRGGFARVVAIDRHNQKTALKQAGADLVVKELSEMDIEANIKELPSALMSFKKIERKFQNKDVVLFFDYDGTLTPIVSHPKDANLSEEMRDTLIKLSNQCSVAIVSGRGLDDVRSRVDIEGLYYAGSHGYEIEGPGIQMEYEAAQKYVELFDRLESQLTPEADKIPGALVERKKFSVALHYRNVDAAQRPLIDALAEKYHKLFPQIRIGTGKMVYELRPDLDWDKGKALEYLIDTLNISKRNAKIFYLGDDITDEDAFNAIKSYGLGIIIGEEDRKTGAQYSLKDVGQCLRFLNILSCSIEEGNSWSLIYNGYQPQQEPLREALCALGNGYFVTRAAGCDSTDESGIHYPGTYLAGGYNRLDTEIEGRIVTNEDLVNFPNWLLLKFKIDNGDWFNIDQVSILDYRQELDMGKGILHKMIHFSDAKGRNTRLSERRLVHMAQPHLAAIEYSIMPLNWEGSITVESALDGGVTNNGVARYRGLSSRHLKLLESKFTEDTMFLKVETVQSNLTFSMASQSALFLNGEFYPAKKQPKDKGNYIAKEFFVEKVTPSDHLRIEKTLAVFNSRDKAISNDFLEAELAIHEIPRFDALIPSHQTAWAQLWEHFHIGIHLRDLQKDYFVKRVVRLYTFHLLQTSSIHTVDMDTGMPARGWHGEAYRGHIFWDEIFIFPIFNYRLPQITQSLILYRYRRLPAARRAAKEMGYKGAMYPWQSGSNGKEETQSLHLNPKSNRWLEDNTHLQRHINSAIVYNIWQYYQVSGDVEFLSQYGAEMIIEIARFWASIASYNDTIERYEIKGVIGPDEYHDAYPDSKNAGINNNAYTNVMAVFVFNKALSLQSILSEARFIQICKKLQVETAEIERWEDLSKKMFIPFHDGDIISQFQDYDKLKEFDWEGYEKKYGNIRRLDRILEAENDSANNYQLSKQADVLMLFYLFSEEELKGLFHQLGYQFNKKMIHKNVDYYLKRTSGGSSLSQIVHAWVSARIRPKESWHYYNEALLTDIEDIQGATTPEGVHIGAMAGSIDMIQRCYTGLEARADKLHLTPELPKEIEKIRLKLHYKQQWLSLYFYSDYLTVHVYPSHAEGITLDVNKQEYWVKNGETQTIYYKTKK